MTEYLTPDGLEKLKKELDYLKNVKRKEVAEKLNYTASFGDLSENAAYDEAKDAQGFLEGRISELGEIISNASVVEKKNTKEVQVGSTVLLSFGSQKEKFQIVGPEGADILNGKISYQSPLGQGVLGKGKGSKVFIQTPESRIEYRIIGIS
ncbi:MAG: transcription elongation factor GreA [Candidatus Paceibacterota bacterium]